MLPPPPPPACRARAAGFVPRTGAATAVDSATDFAAARSIDARRFVDTGELAPSSANVVFGSAVTRTDAITMTQILREIVIPVSFNGEVVWPLNHYAQTACE